MPRILTGVTSDNLSPASVQSSLTHDGVTFAFDRPMFTGQFVTGEPFVISSSGFSVTSISPESGDLNGDGKTGNGTVKNPFISGDQGQPSNIQGFDVYIAEDTGVASTPYSSAINIDPGNSGQPISFQSGEEATLVKSVRLPDVVDGSNWQTIEKYVPLTVLGSAPPANCFMPTWTGETKRLYTAADVDTSVFRNITLPASITESLSDIEASLPKFHGLFGNNNGELLRKFRLDEAIKPTSSNYSQRLARDYALASIFMHSDAYTEQEKQNLLYKLITWGIHLEGCCDRGWRGLGGWLDGAGQHGVYTPIMYLTAFALQSNSMLSKFLNTGQVFDNVRWVTEDFKGIRPRTAVNQLGQPYIDEDVGFPTSTPTRNISSAWATRYGQIAAYIHAWEGASVILLQNGINGETGFEARNQGPFDVTNDRSSIWAQNDRYLTIDPLPVHANATGSDWSDLWREIQNMGIYTPWTGVPEQIHCDQGLGYQGEDGDRITATADGYSWDVSDHDYATEPVTSVDFRHSLDGVQYVENLGAGATGSVSGLLRGVKHYVGLRFVSASGPGPWSQNWPLTINGDWADTDRNAFPTTGTPTATAPTFTTDPVIHYKRSPQWDVFPGNWLPASGTLDADAVDLACGLGYVDGEAEPSFTFQWKRDGVNISGATSQTYTRTVDDAGATLTCEVTPSNSAGTGSAVTTAGVTVPGLATLPTGTLIDTDFRGHFAVNYASELASVVAERCEILHEPNLWMVMRGENRGALFWRKLSSTPTGYFVLSRPASASTLYNISGQIAVTWGELASRADIVLTIENSSGDVLFTYSIPGEDVSNTIRGPRLGSEDNYNLFRDFSGSFTAPAAENLRVRMEWWSGTGGTDIVNMYLTRLLIEEA